MKIRLPLMIQDPTLSGHPRLKRIVEQPYVNEEAFLDGPACRRVAVCDLDPNSGQPVYPAAPVALVNPSGARKLHSYQGANEQNIYANNFIALSAFGTVLRTLAMFEEPDTLGRPVKWGFDGPQLVVVPRAGKLANAFYERDSGCLKFYYFDNPRVPAGDPARTVYTALSRDIVCHETGHAVLDGITPLLYDALTPQAYAIHESIADLVAVVMSFRSTKLREAILEETRGSIDDVGAFSSIGEEFGKADNNLDCLRDLRSPLRIDQVDPADAYALSQVLSGALYNMIIGMHNRRWQKLCGEGADLDYHKSGEALALAVEHFKRMIFRALDYLPPAEVSFADYGRAIIAADKASHPDPADENERNFIRQEFAARGIVSAPEDLEVPTNFEHPAVQELDLEVIVRDGAAARAFAERNRDLLCIPDGVAFTVEPRLDVTKLYYHRDGKELVRECLFKVWWNQVEPNLLDAKYPPQRRINVGTTLAIDWKTRRVRALVTSDLSARPKEAAAQRAARDAALQRLADRNLLQPDSLTDGAARGIRRAGPMLRLLDVNKEA